MRALFVLFALVVCTAAAAAAPYEGGSWNQVWDFSDGVQGWAITGAGSWDSVAGNMYLPDTSFATLNTSLPLGAISPSARFVLQCDMYVALANYAQGSGIAAGRPFDSKGPYIVGTVPGYQGCQGGDKSWDGVIHRKSWGLAVGQWTTLQIDYGYTTSGKYSLYYTACSGNAAGWTAGSWQTILADGSCHPSDTFPILKIGGIGASGVTSWSQARFDNVKLTYVPEPASLLAVTGALVAMAGAFRRRK